MRAVDGELGRGWVTAGHWDDRSLGQLLFEGLGAITGLPLTVQSASRPYTGTLGDVRRDSLRLAEGLRRQGLGAGSVIAFQLPNWVEAVHVFYAATALGATVVPIVHFYGPKELGYILTRSAPDAFVTFESFGNLSGTRNLAAAMAERGAPAPPRVAVVGGEDSMRAWYADDALDQPAAVDPSSPALIAYTSGTTAEPKGVVHTHRTIGFEARQLAATQPPKAPPTLIGAPVGHAIGMLAALLLPVVQRKAINLIDVWDPGAVLARIARDGLMAGTGATFFLTSLLDHPDFDPAVHVPLMRWVGLGGSAVPVAVGERAAALGISTTRAYGSTEHPSVTSSTHDDPAEKRLRTDGRPLPGVELRLDDDGEILTRGPDCFVGYTDPALDEAAFDGEGWFRSGDIGVIDDDGFLTITDRKKDIIIRGGENISAAEVEEVIVRVDGVAECAVVAAPDARLGEHACAFVRLRPDFTGPDPTVQTLRGVMEKAGLARQKWPEEVHVIEDFPRTASGKIRKIDLRARLHPAPEAPDPGR